MGNNELRMDVANCVFFVLGGWHGRRDDVTSKGEGSVGYGVLIFLGALPSTRGCSGFFSGGSVLSLSSFLFLDIVMLTAD